ncbi:MAG: hypothetical protein ACYS8Y_01255 [Planctomycetota bacterium]|jgi:hypothetical protein
MEKVNEKLIENQENSNEKKPYESPVLTKHNPLDSVSVTVYYYYVF